MASHYVRFRGSRRTWSSYTMAFSLGLFCISQPATAIEPVLDFGENPGDLAMFLHRPTALTAGLPLVVALHGCKQTAAAFDDETGLVALAEEVPFLLLLPEQSKKNMPRRCFRWYDARDNRPGQGESASILAMIDFVIANEDVDPEKVYVLGLSAGGAMTTVMIANYPERFAGGAVLAGLPFGCNRPATIFDSNWYWLHYNPFALDGADASYACGINGIPRTNRGASEWATFVRDSAYENPKRWPLVSLWQGSTDTTVDPDNLQELVEQWTAVQGIDAVVDDRERIGDAVRELYRDAAGDLRVESWWLDDYPHAFPIDEDGVPEACGREADFIVNSNICAVRRIAEFWKLR